MSDLGCFKEFITALDATAAFGRGDCIVTSGKTAKELADAALAKGAVPQHANWCPCTEKQAIKDFGEAQSAGYYLQGTFEGDFTQFYIEASGKNIWFV